MLRWMITNGYGDPKTLERRASAMEEWIKDPKLLEPDKDAEYAAIIEIDLNEIKEPLLACPNDPDDIKPLSEVQNTKIDEVFLGSCMTNIGHFRAAGHLLKKHNGTKARFWVVPPTKMDEQQLMEEKQLLVEAVTTADRVQALMAATRLSAGGGAASPTRH